MNMIEKKNDMFNIYMSKDCKGIREREGNLLKDGKTRACVIPCDKMKKPENSKRCYNWENWEGIHNHCQEVMKKNMQDYFNKRDANKIRANNQKKIIAFLEDYKKTKKDNKIKNELSRLKNKIQKLKHELKYMRRNKEITCDHYKTAKTPFDLTDFMDYESQFRLVPSVPEADIMGGATYLKAIKKAHEIKDLEQYRKDLEDQFDNIDNPSILQKYNNMYKEENKIKPQPKAKATKETNNEQIKLTPQQKAKITREKNKEIKKKEAEVERLKVIKKYLASRDKEEIQELKIKKLKEELIHRKFYDIDHPSNKDIKDKVNNIRKELIKIKPEKDKIEDELWKLNKITGRWRHNDATGYFRP